MELRPGTPEEAHLSADGIQRITKLCQSWVDDGTHPALAVLVARRGVIALHEAFGKLGPEASDPPLNVDSIFPIASITKVFTATAAMILVEDGLLGLTRPVQEYVPEFAGEGKELVLVHHLLTHTSGLRDEDVLTYVMANWEAADVPPADDGTDPMTHKQRVLGVRTPLWTTPGREMWYANVNYVVLGDIVRRVARCSLSDFAQERIFAPLRMSDTSYDVDTQKLPGVVRRREDWKMAGAEEFRVILAPAGGVHSTAVDMAVFAQTFLNGGKYGNNRILSRWTVEEMTRNQIPGIPTNFLGQHHAEASWGYGWGLHSHEIWEGFPTLPYGTFGHGGGTGTFFCADPAHSLVFVFLSVARVVQVDSLITEMIWNNDLFANAVYAAIE